MKAAAAELDPFDTMKSVEEPLNTCPVGAEPEPPAGGATLTVRGILAPELSYRVESPVPLSDSQKGPVGE